MAKKPMSARSPDTASTDLPAVSNTTSSSVTPSSSAKAPARSIETPVGWPAPADVARIGLPVLIEARSTPVGAKARTTEEFTGFIPRRP
jgi:hypothetical protein